MEKFVYEGQFIRVSEEKIGESVWERAYFHDGVIIFPINDQGQILLIEEVRPHETPQVRLKPVSGILETDKGTPEENAQRELQEEIGLKAGRMDLLMQIKGTGTINHSQYFYVARDLQNSKLPNPDGDDTILGIKAFSPAELLNLLMTDQIRWSLSTLGLFRLFEVLRRDA